MSSIRFIQPFNTGSLAHLIKETAAQKSQGIILCVDYYSIADVVHLMSVLLIRYNLNCTLPYLYYSQPIIYIKQAYMPIRRELVKPEMAQSMLY
jgi:hypothetical protein